MRSVGRLNIVRKWQKSTIKKCLKDKEKECMKVSESKKYKYPHDLKTFLENKKENIRRLLAVRTLSGYVYDDDYFFAVHRQIGEIVCYKHGYFDPNCKLWSLSFSMSEIQE